MKRKEEKDQKFIFRFRYGNKVTDMKHWLHEKAVENLECELMTKLRHQNKTQKSKIILEKD